MKSKLVSLVCSGCGITFQVIPCQKGRKFCSHECYLKHIPKGKDWKGGTLRGKGSRGPYSESSVKQRAEAKVKKHIKTLDESVDIEKLKYIVSLKYCNSIKMLFKKKKKKDLGRCRTFNSYLKYYNLYEDVLNLLMKDVINSYEKLEIKNELIENVLNFGIWTKYDNYKRELFVDCLYDKQKERFDKNAIKKFLKENKIDISKNKSYSKKLAPNGFCFYMLLGIISIVGLVFLTLLIRTI